MIILLNVITLQVLLFYLLHVCWYDIFICAHQHPRANSGVLQATGMLAIKQLCDSDDERLILFHKNRGEPDTRKHPMLRRSSYSVNNLGELVATSGDLLCLLFCLGPAALFQIQIHSLSL